MPYARILAAALVAGAIASPSHAANLLSNGSFEIGNVLPVNTGEGGPSQFLPSWTLGDPNEATRVHAPVAYPLYPLNATDGSYYIGLPQTPTTGFHINTLSQAFSFSGANGLTLSFDISNEGGFPEPHHVTVQIFDQDALVAETEFSNNTTANGRPDWDHKSWVTSVAPGTYTLTFVAVADNASDILLDNIVLTDVPEPATALVFASALGMLGWTRRRRAA